MECIILFRTNSGKVLVATGDDMAPQVFENRDHAISEIERRPHWSAMLSQIVELDEL